MCVLNIRAFVSGLRPSRGLPPTSRPHTAHRAVTPPYLLFFYPFARERIVATLTNGPHTYPCRSTILHLCCHNLCESRSTLVKIDRPFRHQEVSGLKLDQGAPGRRHEQPAVAVGGLPLYSWVASSAFTSNYRGCFNAR